MPRIWLFSDLHQDHSVNAWDPGPHAPDGGFDLVVVPGDVHSPLTDAIDWLADRFAGVRVVYVPGNHDYYSPRLGDGRFTHDDMMLRGRDLAARRGIDLLSDDSVVVDGTRFVGSTLWTDMRIAPISMAHAFATARRHMSDYHAIRRRPSGRHRHIRVSDTVAMHAASRAFIDGALSTAHDGPTVVVTHHAPHPASLPDPRFDLGWAYASNLGDLIATRSPQLWVHGHLHSRLDYRVGRTRIVANARGHLGEPGRTAFDPSLVLSVAP